MRIDLREASQLDVPEPSAVSTFGRLREPSRGFLSSAPTAEHNANNAAAAPTAAAADKAKPLEGQLDGQPTAR